MAFAQLTYRESLRDIEACLRAQQQKLYHMGIRGTVARSNLADANEHRDWRIYADFAHSLIITARALYSNEPFGIDLEQTVYALDATTIDLCLSIFPWAIFRQTKAAIKLYTLLDLRGNIPTFISISDGKEHDVNILDYLPIESGAFYIMDRGYLDYARLHSISKAAGFFVTRLKSNSKCRRIYSHHIDRSTGLRLRPDNHAYRILCAQRLSRKATPRQILRRRNRENVGFSDQQLLSAGIEYCTTVSLPMASRALFQMDQAKLTNQEFLRHVRECRQDSNLDRGVGIHPGRHTEKTTQYPSESLHNFTNFERLHFRKNTLITTTYRNNHSTGNLGFRKPVEFIHLTVGH